MSRIIIVGAGINGVTAAIELKKRGHQITLVDPGPLPHSLAASTDISKAVRAAYGPDKFYTELAERAIPLWRKWNDELGVEIYHETGVMFVRREEMRPSDFEYESFQVLQSRGAKVQRMTAAEIRERFPAWSGETYSDGVFEPEAGYAESGRVVAKLVERARSMGVELLEGRRFVALDEARANTVILSEGTACPPRQEESRSQTFRATARDPSREPVLSEVEGLGMTRIDADIVVMTTGAWTPYLLPFTRDFFRATGHPVFHLKPKNPELFSAERFPVFGAGISSTGFYGFPLSREGVVKIANHGPGREMSPDSPERAVTMEEENTMREFVRRTFPALADAPVVFTRICLYCDTHDGDFWVAPDPNRPGLVIAAGDSGHGFKFAPVWGEIIADAVEEKQNPLLQKFRWRPEVRAGEQKEAARFQGL